MWGEESGLVGCKIYKSMKGDTGQIDQPFVVTDETFKEWVKIADEAIMKAGQTLTFILLDILEHRTHRSAHKEGRGKHTHSHRPRKGKRKLANFGTNVFIAILIIPLYLLFLHWHERAGGPSVLLFFRQHLKI